MILRRTRAGLRNLAFPVCAAARFLTLSAPAGHDLHSPNRLFWLEIDVYHRIRGGEIF